MMDENIKKIPFEEVVAALLDPDTPLHPKYLYRLSDLVFDELKAFKKAWNEIPLWRKRALLEDLEELFNADYLLSFEEICRFALTDADSQVRFTALRSLREYEVPDLVPQLIEIIRRDDDHELRALAATVLGKYIYLGEIEEIPAKILREVEECLLLATSNHEPEMVRQRAVESLGYSSRKDVITLIQAAFDSPKDTWVGSAILAMGRSCDQRWSQQVLEMLDHPLPEIRFEAVRAAGELEIQAAKPILLELLDQDDGVIRMAAVWSLSQIGGQGISEIFENMLDELENDEEIEIIENAIDNLVFNQSLGELDDDFDDF